MGQSSPRTRSDASTNVCFGEVSPRVLILHGASQMPRNTQGCLPITYLAAITALGKERLYPD